MPIHPGGRVHQPLDALLNSTRMNSEVPVMANTHLTSDDQLVNRVRAEYLEMPGLRLTQQQAQRLWGLDDTTCARILDALVGVKFLTRRPDGQFIRLSEGVVPRLPKTMLKANVRPHVSRARTGERVPAR